MLLPKDLQETLLTIARDSIKNGLEHHRALAIKQSTLAAELSLQRATFVTLLKQQKLRGCIGVLRAFRPLAKDVAENAFAAAFDDPRFTAVSAPELAELEIHLSILSPPMTMNIDSEQQCINALQPGIDGLILEDRGKRGTFLPAVWESLPKPEQFLTQLKLKAGLPADHWSDDIKICRYTVELIK